MIARMEEIRKNKQTKWYRYNIRKRKKNDIDKEQERSKEEKPAPW